MTPNPRGKNWDGFIYLFFLGGGVDQTPEVGSVNEDAVLPRFQFLITISVHVIVVK